MTISGHLPIASGEYVIKIIEPTGYVVEYELMQRIAEIQERNVAAGYLRLRLDVEQEIRERQQSSIEQEIVTPEKPRGQNKPVVVAPGAGVLVPGASRRKVKKGD